MTIETTTEQEIVQRINELRKEKNAVILAHNYQVGEVQDVGDFVGDSLELSRKAAATDADVIVFCGVHFMAETAKVLSPGKIVLLPDPYAGCPMANMITVDELREFKSRHPGVPVVSYVNTSAAVKAESTICCTSANAVKVVDSLDSDEILFVPDKSLAAYVATQTGKKIIAYQGYCPTHHRIFASDVLSEKSAHPEAEVIAHPECSMEIIELADTVQSTAGMLRYVRGSDSNEFIVCTERGLIHRLEIENPGKRFYNPTALNICPNMKKIGLEKVLWSLEDMQYPVEVSEDVIEGAREAIERMLAIA